MWMNRVLFSLKTRLLNQNAENNTPAQKPTFRLNAAEEQAKIIQNRLAELDRRLGQLQSR